jgi:pimeloyl-ACP methyl ester carboxylesterase
LAPLQQQSRAELMAAQRLASPTWPEVELGPWADSKLRLNLAYLDQIQPAKVDWSALLADIRCPVLLLTADPALGALVTEAAAASFQTAVPQTQRVQIAGAGHCIRREQGARYWEAVQAFFAQVN